MLVASYYWRNCRGVLSCCWAQSPSTYGDSEARLWEALLCGQDLVSGRRALSVVNWVCILSWPLHEEVSCLIIVSKMSLPSVDRICILVSHDYKEPTRSQTHVSPVSGL